MERSREVDQDAELMDPSTGAMVPGTSAAERIVTSGAVLMRIENETQMSVAIQRPRNEDKVLKDSIAELERVPQLASKVWYSIKYKKHSGRDGCSRRPGDQCPDTRVEGLSVKAAYALARRWGNAVARVREELDTEEYVQLSGVFLDMETNVRIERSFRASKWKKIGGRMVKMQDRDLDQTVQAGSSKAIRNAIVAALPWWLVTAYWARAREIDVRGVVKDAGGKEAAATKTVGAFKVIGVDPSTIEEWCGHPIAEGFTDEELGDLRGIYNAIKAEGRTAREAFGFDESEEPESHTVTPTDMKGAAAESRGEQPAERAEPKGKKGKKGKATAKKGTRRSSASENSGLDDLA